MSHRESALGDTVLDVCAVDWAPAVARAASGYGHASEQDVAFIGLRNAYRGHGGLSRLRSLSTGGFARYGGNACNVQELAAVGGLFSFQWYQSLWIPMFQFAMPGPTVAIGPRRVVAALGRGFDGWALARWFAEPNAWLASHRPIECLRWHLPNVLEAARADRIVNAGRAGGAPDHSNVKSGNP